MNCPVFFINKENGCILQVITGSEDTAKKNIGQGFQVMDSSMSEGAGEKHIPVVETSGNAVTVSIGSLPHPMSEEHSIEWVYLETNNGGQMRRLSNTGEPKAHFSLVEGEKAIAAYAYCNLHGFWKTEVGR